MLVLPWTKGQPDYRDAYRDGAPNCTGIGFTFNKIGPYAEVPELVIPSKNNDNWP
jgi:hypothetical protein